MTDTRHLVVVGASLAGLNAVEAARGTGFDGPITLVGAESHLPYDRPPLSKEFLDRREPDDSPGVTPFRSLETVRDKLGVTWLDNTVATQLVPSHRIVVAGGREIRYDALLLTTGAHPRTLPGTEALAGVHELRTVDDAILIRRALDTGARTVVVGAGFIGSEVAAAARKRGLPVTIVEALPTPLVRAVGTRMGAALANLHTRHGTDLRCGVGVASIEGDERVEQVLLTDGTVLPADLVVVGIGATPATAWLADSGIALDDGIVCDATLATSLPDVYAAGDVARWHNALFDRSMRLEHWTSASQQGAAAALNALDPGLAKPYEAVPYFWSDWYGSRIQLVGLPGEDEVRVVNGDVAADGFVALYRSGERLAGALALNRQGEVMKYRGLIKRRTSFADALAFAEQRRLQNELSSGRGD